MSTKKSKTVYDARNVPNGGPDLLATATQLGMTVQKYAEYLAEQEEKGSSEKSKEDGDE